MAYAQCERNLLAMAVSCMVKQGSAEVWYTWTVKIIRQGVQHQIEQQQIDLTPCEDIWLWIWTHDIGPCFRCIYEMNKRWY